MGGWQHDCPLDALGVVFELRSYISDICLQSVVMGMCQDFGQSLALAAAVLLIQAGATMVKRGCSGHASRWK